MKKWMIEYLWKQKWKKHELKKWKKSRKTDPGFRLFSTEWAVDALGLFNWTCTPGIQKSLSGSHMVSVQATLLLTANS